MAGFEIISIIMLALSPLLYIFAIVLCRIKKTGYIIFLVYFSIQYGAVLVSMVLDIRIYVLWLQLIMPTLVIFTALEKWTRKE